MKATSIVSTFFAGLALASPTLDTEATNALSKRCRNKDDVTREAHDLCGQIWGDDSSKAFVWTDCNIFKCNCDWGCAGSNGFKVSSRPPIKSGIRDQCAKTSGNFRRVDAHTDQTGIAKYVNSLQ